MESDQDSRPFLIHINPLADIENRAQQQANMAAENGKKYEKSKRKSECGMDDDGDAKAVGHNTLLTNPSLGTY